MAQKTVKKTPAKKVAAVKKAPVKKAVAAKVAPAKKTVAKKTVAKKATAPELKPVIVAAPETHECGCGKNCPCGCKCGCRGVRFFKKFVVILIVFALGFVAAKMCCGGPRPTFVNGCMDVASVKCPKLQNALPMMDMDNDGCITKAEFKAFKHQMRRAVVEQEVQSEIAE